MSAHEIHMNTQKRTGDGWVSLPEAADESSRRLTFEQACTFFEMQDRSRIPFLLGLTHEERYEALFVALRALGSDPPRAARYFAQIPEPPAEEDTDALAA